MLLLTATTDSVSLTTSAAADVDIHASYVDASQADPPVVQATMGRQNTTMNTATTVDIVNPPASSETRNVKTLHIRNTHASTATDVTVNFDQNGTLFELHKANLAAGEALEYVEGVGFFEIAAPASSQSTNKATSSQGPGFSSETYIVGSSLPLAGIGTPVVGQTYHWRFIVSKTAAGTAAPALRVRVGTAGTTSDAQILLFTWGAGTAATDRAEIELDAMFTTVGATAVLRGKVNMTSNLTTTGLSSAVKALQVTSSAFDATVANLIIGLTWNGGASASHTIEYVASFADRF